MDVPKKLLIYYNWLTAASPSESIAGAVAELAKYDMVVIAGSLADPKHANHAAAKQVLNDPGVKHVDFYGYIDTSNNFYDIVDHVAAWKAMGGQLNGIFCDRFGYDYPLYNLEDQAYKNSAGKQVNIMRAHQRLVVREIHLAGMTAFVNAWNQEDVFAPEPGTGLTHNLKPTDWSLLESYQINTGAYVAEKTWRTRMDVVNKYRGQANFAATTTANLNYDNQNGTIEPFNQQKFNYAYVSCLVDQLQAFNWDIGMFGATLPAAPFIPRLEPTNVNGGGSGYVFSSKNNVYSLTGGTTVGASVNTVTHEVSYTK